MIVQDFYKPSQPIQLRDKSNTLEGRCFSISLLPSSIVSLVSSHVFVLFFFSFLSKGFKYFIQDTLDLVGEGVIEMCN